MSASNERRARAKLLRRANLVRPLSERNHFHAPAGQHADERQSDRTAADHDRRVARLDARLVNSAQDAGQRLDHRRVLKGYMFGNHQHVLANDPSGDADIFGVGSVVKQQILAQIALPLAAEQADVARRGIRRHDARADFQAAIYIRTQRFDDSRKFMPEYSRRDNHSRVVSPLPDFQIGAASQSHLYADQRLIRRELGDIHAFDLQILTAIQNRSGHVTVLSAVSVMFASYQGCITTFKEFPTG